MLSPNPFENSRPDGVGVLEILPSGARGADRRTFVPLRRTELRGDVAGPLAWLRLRHVDGFGAEEVAGPIEAAPGRTDPIGRSDPAEGLECRHRG